MREGPSIVSGKEESGENKRRGAGQNAPKTVNKSERAREMKTGNLVESKLFCLFFFFSPSPFSSLLCSCHQPSLSANVPPLSFQSFSASGSILGTTSSSSHLTTGIRYLAWEKAGKTKKRNPTFSPSPLLRSFLSSFFSFSSHPRPPTYLDLRYPCSSCALSWHGLLASSAWSAAPHGSAGATRVNAPAPKSRRVASTRIARP